MLFDADALVNFHVKQLYHNNVMFFLGAAQEIVSLLLIWTNIYIYIIHVDIDTVLFTGKESNDDMPGPTKFKTYLQSWMYVRLPSRMFRNCPLIISIPWFLWSTWVCFGHARKVSHPSLSGLLAWQPAPQKQHDGNHHNVLTKDDAKISKNDMSYTFRKRTNFEIESYVLNRKCHQTLARLKLVQSV